MADMSPEDQAAFASAHADLLRYRSHPVVWSLAVDAARGAIDVETYLQKLIEVPEVATALKVLGGVAIVAASASLAGATGGVVTGPAAIALLTLALNAAVDVVQAKWQGRTS